MELSPAQLRQITGLADLRFEGTTNEQRKHPRMPWRCRAAIQVVRGGNLEAPDGILLRDISATGIGFLYGGPMKLGDVFALHLPCKVGGVLKLWCVVKRHEPGSQHAAVGATFHKLLETAPAASADASANQRRAGSAASSAGAAKPESPDKEIARIREAVLSAKI